MYISTETELLKNNTKNYTLHAVPTFSSSARDTDGRAGVICVGHLGNKE